MFLGQCLVLEGGEVSRNGGRLFEGIFNYTSTAFKLCVFISELYRDKIDEQIPTFVPEARGEPKSEL